MKSVGLVYWSGGGNTEAMAEALKEGFTAAGADLYFSPVGEADAAEFFSKDLLVLGSPACGTEEIDDTEMQPFIDDNADSFNGKDLFLFGSFGWGGGQFAQDWKDRMESDHSANVVADPITCLEAPEDDTLNELKAKAEELVK